MRDNPKSTVSLNDSTSMYDDLGILKRTVLSDILADTRNTSKVYCDCKMADLCIVCDAFLQSFGEYLLCDRCRKPAESSVDKNSTVGEGVDETPLYTEYARRFQKKFQAVEDRIPHVKRRLHFSIRKE
ncbi:hypothetical protein ACROYT_G033798 [Oculina patagonica]